MQLLFRCEFRTNYEEWVDSVKPRFRPHTTYCVQTAINISAENIKTLYKVRSEMRASLRDLLKVCINLLLTSLQLSKFTIFYFINKQVSVLWWFKPALCRKQIFFSISCLEYAFDFFFLLLYSASENMSCSYCFLAFLN